MNYDELTKKIKECELTIKDIDSQRGAQHRNIDKCGLHFRYANRDEPLKRGCHHNFNEAHISFDAYAGYYGSSNVSDRMSKPLANYILAALNTMKGAIINTAIEIINKEIQHLGQVACKEADEIKILARSKEE